jgi:hypothetical protein
MQSETRPQVALPKHVHLEEHGERTTVSWRWLTWQHGLMAFMLLFINAFYVVFFLNIPMYHPEKPLESLLITLFMASVPVCLNYSTLAGLLNTTRIELSRDELRIQHGPVPWLGNRTVPARDITQLHGQAVRTGRAGYTYSLFALDKAGRKVKLLSGLENKDQVLSLEQALEHRLGLEDRPVEGELAQRNQVA